MSQGNSSGGIKASSINRSFSIIWGVLMAVVLITDLPNLLSLLFLVLHIAGAVIANRKRETELKESSGEDDSKTSNPYGYDVYGGSSGGSGGGGDA